MMNIHWPFVMVTSIVLYVLILISLPINELRATIFLFVLIGYWSRLPGVGILTPGNLLYATDLVDFFAFIISINMGGIPGASYQAFCNIASRAAGITPRWEAIIKDVVAQGIACICTPLVYDLTGQNLVQSILIYSIIRWAVFIPMRFIEPTPRPWPEFIVRLSVIQFSTLLVNSFYATYFGWYFDALLESGVSFSWSLFWIVSLVIIISNFSKLRDTGIKFLNYRHWAYLILKKLFKDHIKQIEIKKINDEIIVTEAKEIFNYRSFGLLIPIRNYSFERN